MVEGPSCQLDGQCAGGSFSRPGYFTVSGGNKLEEVVDERPVRREGAGELASQKGSTEPMSREGAV